MVLTRMDSLNPALNAVVELRPEAARQEADAADEAIACGGDVGPLHGVPMTIKDGVWAALSTALEAGLWGCSVSPGGAPLFRGRKLHLTQRLPGGFGEHQSGDDAGKGGGNEVEGGRDRVARGRQEGGEDQGRRPTEDGDRDAVAQRE